MSDTEPIYYADYLQLDRLLDCQRLESERAGSVAHDEMLFIIVHQAYELWFKQILWEIRAVKQIFDRPIVEERDVSKAVHHLNRVVEIQRVTIQQIDILETMTPLDFLEFRDVLIPASGFQSVQFRLIENELGLRPEDRLGFGGTKYTQRLRNEHRDVVERAESEDSLHDLIERWLARTPFLSFGSFDFWQDYSMAVAQMLQQDVVSIRFNPTLTDAQKQRQLEGLEDTRRQFAAVTDESSYDELAAEGLFRMSHKAFTAALLIQLYRDEPILSLPFRLLTHLMDIDENFSAWRYRHAMMVLRMLGSKIGTGGSSGHDYLREVADHNRVFKDLFRVSTFLIPRSSLPRLPDDVAATMGFRYDNR